MKVNAPRRAISGLASLLTIGLLAAAPAAVSGGSDVITTIIVSDANNEFSSDLGLTWAPVALATPHALYAAPIGTSLWITYDSSPTQTALLFYRETFDLPADCDAATASLSVTLHVDNDANVFLNDVLFGTTPVGSVVGNFQDPAEGPYVATGPFLATGNVLLFKVGDYGLPTALDYQAVLTCDPINLPPTADAGPDQTVTETPGGTQVSLDASGSTDPEDDPLTYEWTGPFDGGTASGESPTVTFGSSGTHTVTLTVEAGEGGTDTDDVVITVQPAATPTPSPTPTLTPSPTQSPTPTPTPRGAVLGGTPTPRMLANTAASTDPVALGEVAIVIAALFLVSANLLAFGPIRSSPQRRR